MARTLTATLWLTQQTRAQHMPELETLYVRIETDLSNFKQGMTEARRERQAFAPEARGTFAGVNLQETV